jgi:uncharacterized membrane-anchored protein YitT (DUF2179 family)
MNKSIIKREFLNTAWIALGALILAIGVVGFLTPNKIATGGTAGLAIIFYHLMQIPMGILLFLINLPLLLVSVKYLGKNFALRTVVAIVFTSIFIDVLNEVWVLGSLSDHTMLATIYGGLLSGLGIGFIFKGDASAGGGTIIARIVSSKTTIKPGDIILAIDIIVVVLAALVFSDLELALWSMISIYVTAKFVDLITSGRRQNRIVHIATESPENINQLIAQEMGLTGTILQGDNLENTNSKKIIFLSVNKNRILTLKNLIHHADDKARMVVFEATEVLDGK